MELIDILNSQGQATGLVNSKAEVHRQGLWHAVAHVWIVNSQKEVLLQLRSQQKKYYPNHWDISVAGHISSGESMVQGALREVQEEIGLSLKVRDLKLIGHLKDKSVQNQKTYFDNEFSDIFLVKLDLDLNQLHLQKEELARVQWISIDKLKQWIATKKSDLVPHLQEYSILLKALQD